MLLVCQMRAVVSMSNKSYVVSMSNESFAVGIAIYIVCYCIGSNEYVEIFKY